jgi:hypothetical protein
MTGRSSFSPARTRRTRAERARTLTDIQSRASPRSIGGIGATAASMPGTNRGRSAIGRATRRTTAFTRSSRVTRNGAENMLGPFLGGGRISPADVANMIEETSLVN